MKETIIEKKRSAFRINLREILEYRELLWTLTYRDLRVKYAQTVIGFLWVFLNPLFTLIILNFVFGTVAKVDTGESSQNMIKKIYFPRLVIPLSKAITALINFGVVLLCLGIIMAIMRYHHGNHAFSAKCKYRLQSVFHSDGTHIRFGRWHLDERIDDTLP